jgi:cell division septation protein DedD
VDSSVKERLTGALIFVAAVIIVVPEMLLGPGNRRAAVEVAADAADTAAPVRTYSMPVEGGTESVAAVAAPASPPEPVVEAAPLAAPAPEALPEAPASVAAASTSPPAPAEASASPAPAPAAKPPAQERAATGNWWTQVGIFSSRDNADRLAKRLRDAGFAIEVSKYVSGGKDMFRVRAGPVADRAEAQALLARLKAAGHSALVVAP